MARRVLAPGGLLPTPRGIPRRPGPGERPVVKTQTDVGIVWRPAALVGVETRRITAGTCPKDQRFIGFADLIDGDLRAGSRYRGRAFYVG
jgi:hypothetical protein